MIYVMLAVTLLLAAAVFGLVKKLREKNQMLEQQMKDRKKMQEQVQLEYDEIWNIANRIHLYAALSEEEARSEKLKEKQREIMKQAEVLLCERKR
nr:hypothetical protein [uncultured Blautia sp.]